MQDGIHRATKTESARYSPNQSSSCTVLTFVRFAFAGALTLLLTALSPCACLSACAYARYLGTTTAWRAPRCFMRATRLQETPRARRGVRRADFSVYPFAPVLVLPDKPKPSRRTSCHDAGTSDTTVILFVLESLSKQCGCCNDLTASSFALWPSHVSFHRTKDRQSSGLQYHLRFGGEKGVSYDDRDQQD